MAYRIKPHKPFTAAFQSVAIQQLQAAIVALQQRPGGLHQAVHEARKKFKRLRALYRLVASDAKTFREQENARLRQAAASLSRARDATALIEVIAYLQGHSETPEEDAALSRARAALSERRHGLDDSEHDLEDRANGTILSCEQAIGAVNALIFDDRPRKTARRLGRGWRKDLEQGRAALATCRDSGHAEHFHQLRKCGQVYWMHLTLLRPLWPSAMRAKQEAVKRLVDMLGHEHDLSLLVALLDQEPQLLGSAEELSHLLGCVIRQQQMLRHAAVCVAEEVFIEDPQTEADIVATLWIQACG